MFFRIPRGDQMSVLLPQWPDKLETESTAHACQTSESTVGNLWNILGHWIRWLMVCGTNKTTCPLWQCECFQTGWVDKLLTHVSVGYANYLVLLHWRALNLMAFSKRSTVKCKHVCVCVCAYGCVCAQGCLVSNSNQIASRGSERTASGHLHGFLFPFPSLSSSSSFFFQG